MRTSLPDQMDIDCCQQEQRSFRQPARPRPDETCACLAVSIWIDEIERARWKRETHLAKGSRTNRTSLFPQSPHTADVRGDRWLSQRERDITTHNSRNLPPSLVRSPLPLRRVSKLAFSCGRNPTITAACSLAHSQEMRRRRRRDRNYVSHPWW